MERQGINSLKSYREVIILTVITVTKLLFFHHFIGVTQGYWIITLLNGLTIFGVYLWVNLIKNEKRIKFLLLSHLIISMIFFADSMYFSHFFTLMPIHIIYQVRHLKGVSTSVNSLMRLKYLLFFTDVLLLWWYQRRLGWKVQPLQRERRLKNYLVILTIGLVVLGSSQGLYNTDTGYYTPLNLGVFNYHIYDVATFLKQTLPEEEEYQETWTEILHEEDEKEIKGQYFGLVEGRNVIVIQVESLQSFVLNRQVEGQWITPVLNQLIQDDSLYFSRYYEQVGWGNTSDAEFVSQTGYHASIKNFSYKQYEGKSLVTLPKLLMEKNYKTIVFHGNEESFWNRDDFYPYLGVQRYISKEHLVEEEIIGMGIGDRSLFQQSVPILKSLDQPFYSFYITLTSHYPYILEDEYKYLKLGQSEDETILDGYLQSVKYLDTALGEYIQSLKEAGLYDNSIIVIYGDHHGLKAQNEETAPLMEEFLGKEYREEEMLRIPLIIHIPKGELQQKVTTLGGQVDLFPTLSNLLGLETGNLQLVGKDLLNTNDNFALNMIHTAKGSFIKDDYIFIMSRDGIFENSSAWNVFTGESVDIEKCREGYERALAEISLSEYILEKELILIKNAEHDKDDLLEE